MFSLTFSIQCKSLLSINYSPYQVINAVKAIRDQLQHHKQELKKLNKLKKELQQTLSKPVNPLEKGLLFHQQFYIFLYSLYVIYKLVIIKLG